MACRCRQHGTRLLCCPATDTVACRLAGLGRALLSSLPSTAQSQAQRNVVATLRRGSVRNTSLDDNSRRRTRCRHHDFGPGGDSRSFGACASLSGDAPRRGTVGASSSRWARAVESRTAITRASSPSVGCPLYLDVGPMRSGSARTGLVPSPPPFVPPTDLSIGRIVRLVPVTNPADCPFPSLTFCRSRSRHHFVRSADYRFVPLTDLTGRHPMFFQRQRCATACSSSPDVAASMRLRDRVDVSGRSAPRPVDQCCTLLMQPREPITAKSGGLLASGASGTRSPLCRRRLSGARKRNQDSLCLNASGTHY